MIKVIYDGEYPTSCMGRLIIKENKVEVYNKQFCCYSTGKVTLEGDPAEWNWVVEDGELLWDEDEAVKFSEEIQDEVRSVLSGVPVCCGGCI